MATDVVPEPASLEPQLSAGSWREALLVAAVTVALLLPFLDKAAHIDDPLFIWCAQHILQDPLDFYAFDVNWYGDVAPMHEVSQNPPLACYYLALFGGLFGFSEMALHAAMLLPAVATTIGIYRVACRFCSQPLLAAFLSLATPVLLVSATALMCDVLMLAFWVWAVECWLRAVARGTHGWLAVSAVLMALAALTKYFGAALVPLLAVYTLCQPRPTYRFLLWCAVPLAVLAGYDMATRSIYGHGLVTQAAFYAAEFDIGESAMEHGLVGVIYVGGCLVSALPFAPRMWSRAQLALGAAIVATVAGALTWFVDGDLTCLPLRSSSERWWLMANVVVFFTAGVNVIALVVAELRRRYDADGLLLGLWAAGTLLFAVGVNWTINGRSVLPAAPALSMLLVRRLDFGADGDLRSPVTGLRWALVAPGALLTIAVAWGDYRLANSARTAADLLHEKHADQSDPLLFQAHWGFQYYMQLHGAQRLDISNFALPQGTQIITPLNNVGHLLPGKYVDRIDVISIPIAPWTTTVAFSLGTNFYASTVGALPYFIGPVPPERYGTYRVRRNVRRVPGG